MKWREQFKKETKLVSKYEITVDDVGAKIYSEEYTEYLESKLKIAVEALEDIWDFEDRFTGKIAREALKQIKGV